MEQVTAFFLNILEIIEKEGKLARLVTVRTLKGLAWFFVGATLLGLGFLVLIWACFTALASVIGPALAGLAASILILAGGGAFLWLSRKNLK